MSCEDRFNLLLALVKNYIVNTWKTCKLKLYGDDSSQFLSSTENLGNVIGFEGHSGVGVCQGAEPDTQYSSICMNVCCSAYENACMVDGMYAKAANQVLLLISSSMTDLVNGSTYILIHMITTYTNLSMCDATSIKSCSGHSGTNMTNLAAICNKVIYSIKKNILISHYVP